MTNPEKLATHVTQDEEKQTTIPVFVGHHYMQTNTNNLIINKT